jgi:nitroimidazol reductase NimA-like FMN-containing flavoprotein (pyridoxamine 5'-phosphate oxidase superfamily)
LGRIAISQQALPFILPVNFALDGANIVFRTRQGGMLDRGCRNTVVAFEVDEYDRDNATGWSVVVVGVANVLYAGEWLRAVELGLTSAGAGDGELFVKIVPGSITGRAIEGALIASPTDDRAR